MRSRNLGGCIKSFFITLVLSCFVTVPSFGTLVLLWFAGGMVATEFLGMTEFMDAALTSAICLISIPLVLFLAVWVMIYIFVYHVEY